ncbi:SWIM zinc finger family protein [Streptomyces sp. P17]|uniref:SWIM zinc finger family protein n=1 Tax=Streptomyces sp. P17 TaxID=3074716 RepID=UPI0028F40494|nr:SWIM zinc finger family protein [Streptomyces sp. P17]MDT9698199.1 SWIM zinc finger family protein [Streptomyces sp. P17]
MTPRPSEEARRALRAARERSTQRAEAPEGTGAKPAEGAGGPDASAEKQETHPADAARAALRRAATQHTDTSAGAGTPAPAHGASPADQPAARPADVAREALRAARRDRRRTEPDPANPVAGPAHTAHRPPHPTRSDVPAARARALRELLADAFRLPAEAESPQEEPTETRSAAGVLQDRDDDAPLTESREDRTAVPDGGRPAPRGGGSVPRSGRGRADSPADDDDSPSFAVDATPVHRATSAPGAPPFGAFGGPDTQATPSRPRTMAAPSRDGDLRRTFPAFPPRPSGDAGFAETWWGNAWVSALEEGALDGKRLARGRGYAEQGHVDAITVTPGLVLAYVKGSRPRPYRVQVRLRTLDDAEWNRFLDVAAERPGHIAALLDKEMPHSLAECGVPLLPGPRDLDPRCSCPDSGHPCKHAAALCYQTARLLDADPFVLLLLRGRGERELLDALSRLSAARAARAAQDREPAPLPGVRASKALAPRELPPLPSPLPVPPYPEQPPVYPAAPGGPDPFALDQLATDAAARAHALLGTGRDPLAELTLWQDAVRIAAARPGSGLTAGTRALYSSLASAAERTPAELARAVAAWRQGGAAGLAVLEEAWDPPAGRFDRARPLLLAADLPAFRPWRNRLTHPRGHVQLRLGRDGLWYAYESEPGHDDWWPRGTPDLDPVGALTGLGGPVEP